jgi:hypothetical protein
MVSFDAQGIPVVKVWLSVVKVWLHGFFII